MLPEIVTIFNLVAPIVFREVAQIRSKDPVVSYKDALEIAGVKLDAEYQRLLADMAKDVAEGAVPHAPQGS